MYIMYMLATPACAPPRKCLRAAHRPPPIAHPLIHHSLYNQEILPSHTYELFLQPLTRPALRAIGAPEDARRWTDKKLASKSGIIEEGHRTPRVADV